MLRISIKLIPLIIFCVLTVLPGVAFSKSAKDYDIKFNPNVDYNEDLKTDDITVFEFENVSGEGDIIMDPLHQEIIQYLENNDVAVDVIYDDEIGEKQDEFSLDSLDEDEATERKKLYRLSPTDLILSGSMIRLDSHSKNGWVEDKKFWTASIEYFVYSKSLDTIIYKSEITRILKQKHFLKFKKHGKDARQTLFRSCVEQCLEPFVEKLKRAGDKGQSDKTKYKRSLRYLNKKK